MHDGNCKCWSGIGAFEIFQLGKYNIFRFYTFGEYKFQIKLETRNVSLETDLMEIRNVNSYGHISL